MARLALIFTALTLAALQYGVLADTTDVDLEVPYVPEEDPADRAASASAHATAQAVNQGQRIYPTPPVYPQNGVRCVACSDCPSVGNVTTSKTCPYSPDPKKNGKCITFSEKYYHMKKPWVIRGCVTERGTCAEIKSAVEPQSDVVKLLSCQECEGDLCNGAGHYAPDIMAALVAVFVSPLLMKYTLS